MGIQLTIRLFGTLSSRLPEYSHTKGLLIEAPDGVTPEEVLKRLKIPLSHAGLISCDNKSIGYDTPLTDKAVISFFSPMAGG